MKIGVVGDIHWSKYSSIVRSRGIKYSTRLENCIESINWAEDVLSYCDKIVYLGDFFDHDELKSEEVTALSEIKWNDVEHYFLVGNHELGLSDLSFSSAHVFNLSNKKVIDSPMTEVRNNSDCEFCYIPYILNNSGDIKDYIINKGSKHRIIFSHNDIAGVQLGKFISKSGFEISSIEENCDLFINGHIHNGSSITEKIYNVGNLTGQNFSEDALYYRHCIFIIDTDTYSISQIYENPYALNFYKFENLETLLKHDFNSTSVVTAKLYNGQIKEAKEFIENNKNIVAHRFIIQPEVKGDNSSNSISLAVNHLEKFQEFILDRLGNDKLVIEELEEVMR